MVNPGFNAGIADSGYHGKEIIMPIININNNRLSFEPGQTILEVARENQIHIPTLCYLSGCTPTGQCRICVVEVEGTRELLPACETPAGNGMVVMTQSPAVIEARKTIIEMLISSGAHNCLLMDSSFDSWNENQAAIMDQPWHDNLCPAYGDCRLQDLAIEYNVKVKGTDSAFEGHPLDDASPVIIRDFSRCIGCGRCVQACNEVQVNLAIKPPFGRREDHPDGWYPAVDLDACTHCGECIQVCPVGALFEKKAFGLGSHNDMETIRTTCPYCGVGCQQLLHVKDEKIVKVTGVEDGSPNKGRLCVKGRFGYDFIYSEERLKTPMLRKNGKLVPVSWNEALDYTADKLKAIIEESGPDAVAGVACARSINEDSYQMQKLFRSVFKTNNIDHCART